MTHIPCWASWTELGLDSGRASVRAGRQGRAFQGEEPPCCMCEGTDARSCVTCLRKQECSGGSCKVAPGVTVAFRIGGSATTSPGRSWSLAIIQSKCGHWGSVRSAAPWWERMAAERRALEAGQRGWMVPPAWHCGLCHIFLFIWTLGVSSLQYRHADGLHLQPSLKWLMCSRKVPFGAGSRVLGVPCTRGGHMGRLYS